LPGDEAVLVPADMTERDLAAILYTSGSTGAPKGVMLPYGQHCSNGRQAEAAGDITAADRLFLCLPLHHNMAQGYAVWPALLTGASIRLVDRFRRDRFWAQVRESEATVWPFVGSLLALLLGQPESADDAVNPIRVAYGVPIPASVHRRFEARFDVRLVHGYGSTEATIPVWSDPGSPPGAAGRVVDGYDVSVQDDCGRPVPVDEIGEIAVRARQPFTMFAGYFNDPVRTAQAWRDGWFLTGDRGSFDADGRLWFRGRAGDAIRRFGEFIDAEEVENAALAHPAVVDAACFAVDDDVAGQEAALSVVVRADITTAEIHQHIRGRLPGYAVPRFIEIAESLPKTATGKVQRFALREQGVRITMDDFLTHERQKAQ
jgi:crotonobetaine/carnitine-CoA ligase